MKRAPWSTYVVAIAVGVPCLLAVVWLGADAEEAGVSFVQNWIGFASVSACLLGMFVRDHRWALRRPGFLGLMSAFLALQVAGFIAALQAFAFEWRAASWGIIFMFEYAGVSTALTWFGYPAGGRTDPTRRRAPRR